MLMMRMLAQLLAAVVLTWKCIAPVDTVRGAGRPREARVQAPSTRSFKRGTQPCCVEAVPGERKMNIFCLSARKILLTLSGFACRYWSSPAGFSTMWSGWPSAALDISIWASIRDVTNCKFHVVSMVDSMAGVALAELAQGWMQ
jgi:hypothetical protein